MSKSLPNQMKNISPVTRKWLARLGIESARQLKEQGAEKIYKDLLAVGHPESPNLLRSLIGAAQNKDWRAVDEKAHRKLKVKN
jgi:hypothetical protein